MTLLSKKSMKSFGMNSKLINTNTKKNWESNKKNLEFNKRHTLHNWLPTTKKILTNMHKLTTKDILSKDMDKTTHNSKGTDNNRDTANKITMKTMLNNSNHNRDILMDKEKGIGREEASQENKEEIIMTTIKIKEKEKDIKKIEGREDKEGKEEKKDNIEKDNTENKAKIKIIQKNNNKLKLNQ